MRDALGGYFNLTILIFFIIMVTALIALALNYTRAYRVKDHIITYIEKYEGNMEENGKKDGMYSHINDYIKSVGYVASRTAMDNLDNKQFRGDTYTCVRDQGWCYSKSTPQENERGEEEFHVNVVVFVNSHLPFINQLFSNQFFWMKGTTTDIPVFD